MTRPAGKYGVAPAKVLQVLRNNAESPPMCTTEILDALSTAYDIYPDTLIVRRVCRQLVSEGVVLETRLRRDKPGPGSRALVLAWKSV